MEMLVATAILLVAVGVLTELADMGRQHARGAEDAAAAQRICQNILDEILCGARPLQAVSETTLLDDPDWTFSIDLKSLERFEWEPRLAELRVTVTRAPDETKRLNESKTLEEAKPGKTFSLTRWIRYSSGEKPLGDGRSRPAAPPGSHPGSRGPQP
jgi:hypothetical protein